MANKQEVLKAYSEHPGASSGWLAEHIGCRPEYVRATLQRAGIKISNKPSKTLRLKKESKVSLMKRAALLRARAEELEAIANTLPSEA